LVIVEFGLLVPVSDLLWRSSPTWSTMCGAGRGTIHLILPLPAI